MFVYYHEQHFYLYVSVIHVYNFTFTYLVFFVTFQYDFIFLWVQEGNSFNQKRVLTIFVQSWIFSVRNVGFIKNVESFIFRRSMVSSFSLFFMHRSCLLSFLVFCHVCSKRYFIKPCCLEILLFISNSLFVKVVESCNFRKKSFISSIITKKSILDVLILSLIVVFCQLVLVCNCIQILLVVVLIEVVNQIPNYSLVDTQQIKLKQALYQFQLASLREVFQLVRQFELFQP
eukprot:TRINITY_DN18886_c0_g3_i2.p1 TRINITY_DN18886_c0_g3~~TRINITY_DN18886_c0_g3_i2.p1  ORF type:complete len:231 (+),score=-10.65 TRINITY_DN18886_c0_g3_i2:562-1254(+)